MGAIGDAVRSCERHADDPGRAASGGRNHAHLRRLWGRGKERLFEHRAGRRDGERGGFGWNADELLRATLYVAVSVDRPRGAAVATGSGNDDRDCVSTGRGSVRRTDVLDGDARSTSNRLFVSQLLLRAPREVRSAWAGGWSLVAKQRGVSGDGGSRSGGERARGVVPELSALWPEPQTEGQLVDDRAVPAMHGACAGPDHAGLLSTAPNRTLRRGLCAECAEPGDRPGIPGCSEPLGYPTEPGQRRARVSTEGRLVDSCEVGDGDASQRSARRRR